MQSRCGRTELGEGYFHPVKKASISLIGFLLIGILQAQFGLKVTLNSVPVMG